MHISDISISTFRLFKDFSVQLNKGLNVIVGENNSGKTALVDAIRLVLDTNSSEWAKISDFDFYENADKFHIQLKFDDITPEQASVFVEHLTHEEIGDGTRKCVLYVNLKANVTNVIKRGSRYIRSELRSGANADGPMIEREIREYLSATYLKPLRDAETELNAGRNSRLSQIISSSAEFSRKTVDGSFQTLIEEFIRASETILENGGLKSDADKIDTNLQNLVFNQDNFQPAIQMLGSKVFADMSISEKERAFQDILQKLSLVLDKNKPLQGLGYNNVLFMATELLLLEQEKEDFPLLLIEEPEAHLHPQLQMKFLKFIRDEYSTQEKPRLQTILTTHSPNLASKAPLESIILMKDAKAFPMRKDETQLDPDDYVFLEKFLDVTKSNLFFAKGVLVVEGDAESILLPTIAECLGHSLEDYGVSIVNVGSTAYARFAKIFLRSLEVNEDIGENWIKIPISCVRDLDLWPQKVDKAVAPDIGWKEFKDGNKQYWLPRNDPDGNAIGTGKDEKTTALQGLSAQNVRVYVSDEWTLEYCLIRSGLDGLICEILGRIDNLRADPEEKAIQIYKKIETSSGMKSKLAYELAVKLKENYDPKDRAKREDLLSKLPEYIKDAFKHVLGTGDLSIPEPNAPENDDQGVVAVAEELAVAE